MSVGNGCALCQFEGREASLETFQLTDGPWLDEGVKGAAFSCGDPRESRMKPQVDELQEIWQGSGLEAASDLLDSARDGHIEGAVAHGGPAICKAREHLADGVLQGELPRKIWRTSG